MNDGFIWGEVQQPPSLGLQADAHPVLTTYSGLFVDGSGLT